MNYKEEFERIEKLVLDTEDKDYFCKYLSEARDLISDVQYFQGHIARTRKSKRFSLEILPSFNGVIMDWFVKKLFYNYNQSHWMEEDKMINRLKIYDITYVIFDKINNRDKKKGWSINKKWIRVAIEWGKVLKYYTDIDIKNEIQSFNGYNHSIEQIREVWEKVEAELTNH